VVEVDLVVFCTSYDNGKTLKNLPPKLGAELDRMVAHRFESELKYKFNVEKVKKNILKGGVVVSPPFTPPYLNLTKF
jgi:hypothetical protein